MAANLGAPAADAKLSQEDFRRLMMTPRNTGQTPARPAATPRSGAYDASACE